MTYTDAPFTLAQRALLAQLEAMPPEQAADGLLKLAASYWRAGQEAQFAACFRRSFLLKRFSELPLLCENIRGPALMKELRAMASVLARHGAAYAPVLGHLAEAEARLGHVDAVKRLVDFDRFFLAGDCPPPDGASVDDFNAAVAQEIKADLVYYGTPESRAIRRGYRRNDVMQATSPALAALRRQLQRLVEDYVAALPDDPTHPFLASRPDAPVMDGWAVVSTADSFHHAHIHPSAWATGVYYVTQPPVSRDGERGWLEVGPPNRITPQMGWERRLVEPRRGSFILMPAYFFHATQPMGVDEERICIAFEAQFPELSLARGGGDY